MVRAAWSRLVWLPEGKVAETHCLPPLQLLAHPEGRGELAGGHGAFRKRLTVMSCDLQVFLSRLSGGLSRGDGQRRKFLPNQSSREASLSSAPLTRDSFILFLGLGSGELQGWTSSREAA